MAFRGTVGWILAAATLGAVAIVAPRLSPAALLPISALWLGGAALVVGRGVLAIRRSAGLLPAAIAVGLGLGGPAWLFGTDWSGSAGTFLPCRRNWGWLPSYLLRSSPTQSVAATVGETRIKICYGSPRARGRKMIGGPAVPFGRLWRTGANEPTTIRFDGPIEIAGLPAKPGKLALYTVPGPETWEIVLNRSTGQWGIEAAYSGVASEEFGRAIVVSGRNEFREALTITIAPTPRSDSADVVIRWESTEVRIPLTAVNRSR